MPPLLCKGLSSALSGSSFQWKEPYVTCYTSRLTRHSKRSEESRYQPLAAHWQVNTVGEKPPFGGHASIEYQFRHVPSSTPSPLRGPLLHGKACHWILRSLSLPYESSSFATLKGAQDVTGPAFVSPLRPPSFRAMGSAGMNHIFVKTVKGSREISQQIAACRPPRPHRVSYRLAVSSTSSPLRGSLLHRKASHVVFRSLTLPCKPRSLAPQEDAGALRAFLSAFHLSSCIGRVAKGKPKVSHS